MSEDITTNQRPSADEVFESLNGFDEIAIFKAFKVDITKLAEHQPTTFMRALVFTLKRREGSNDADAKSYAMGLKVSEVTDCFLEDEDAMPDEPDSESGKGESLPAPQLTSSPTSAS